MNGLWARARTLADLGTVGVPEREARRIRFANLWSLVQIALLTPHIAVDLALGYQALALSIVGVIGAYIAFLLLNRAGHFRAVRVGLVALANGVLVGWSVAFGTATRLPEILFCVALLPMLLSSRHDRLFRGVGIGVPALAAMGLQWLEPALPRGVISPEHQLYFAYAMTPTIFIMLSVAFLSLSIANEKGEERLEMRNDQMRNVLDAIDEALFMINLDGRIVGARSAAATSLLGASDDDVDFTVVVRRLAPHAAAWLELGLASLRDDMLPREVLLEQLPGTLHVGERTLRVRYQPLADSSRLLVIVTDDTAEVARARLETERQELAAAVEHLVSDRNGFLAFVAECDKLVEHVTTAPATSADELVVTRRALHTLKGNANMFGLATVAAAAHALEDRFASDDGVLKRDIDAFANTYRNARQRLERIMGDVTSVDVVVDAAEHADAVTALEQTPAFELADRLRSWAFDPSAILLRRIGQHGSALAERLGKDVDIVIDDHGLRFAPAVWSPVWASLVHAVRNAVDHGLESADERRQAGKTTPAQLLLRTRVSNDTLEVVVADNGRGVNWQRLAQRAHALGVAAHEVLFVDGVSTKDDVSDISGRGVGMGALKASCEALGGTISVEDRVGGGTAVVLRFARHQHRGSVYAPAPHVHAVALAS